MPNPVILSVNAGSSSIKYSLYEKTNSNLVNILLDASISGLTAPPSQFTYTLYDTTSQTRESKEIESYKAEEIDVSNHEDAFRYFLEFLKSGKGRKTKGGVIELDRISVVCHRIVHGGPEPRPLIITQQELHRLDELSDLAPLYSPTSLLTQLLSHSPPMICLFVSPTALFGLMSLDWFADCRHNYAALLIVRACLAQLKGIQNVAFFDSSFHMTLEKKRWMYPIDPKIAETKGIRKYGFHGLSYSFIIRAVAKYLNKVPIPVIL